MAENHHNTVALSVPGPRRLDPRVREFVSPTRVVWTSPQGVTGADHLVGAKLGVSTMEIGTVVPACKMQAGVGSALVLDYGREMHGGIRLDVPTTSTGKSARVRIRFGESVSEAMGEPNNDHTIHDFETRVAWMGYVEVGCTGFRFVRIDLLDEETSIDLRRVSAVAIYRDIPRIGSFACSDLRLNEIWDVGARTVHLCMQDSIWDAIKRDRLTWIGDIHPETRVISAVFGRNKAVDESLDLVRDSTPLPGWMNGVSSYSLWWIITHYDWFLYHGDVSYLREQRDYLLPLLAYVEEHIDASGAEKLDGWRFIEWPTAEDPVAIAEGLQALLSIALDRAAAILSALQDSDLAEKTASLARLCASVKPPASDSKQANALISLAGMADAEQVNDRILSVDPFRGLSTFYGYYVLEARAKAGDYAGCLELIRRYWGGMLDLGATTFWEHFEIDWMENAGRIDEVVPDGRVDIHTSKGDYCYEGLRHSFCHGWAAGPTAWLSEHVLGVRPTSPGFATAIVRPHLSGLEWAHGVVPTPHGPIEVIHQVKKNGNVTTEVKAPEQIRIED